VIVKLIRVWVKPGHMQGFLEAQAIWNRESRTLPGYLGEYVGRVEGDGDSLSVLIYWRSSADLAHFMARDHDRIAVQAGAEQHYERIEVQVLAQSVASACAPAVCLPEAALEAAEIQLWSELYRATAVLRAAVRAALFDHLAGAPRSTGELARRLALRERPLARLLAALAAMELVELDEDRWRNTPLAARTLVSEAPAYQGDMILHNSRPDYIQGYFELEQHLGFDPEAPDTQRDSRRFIRAMGNTAAGGQAAVLTEQLALDRCRHLIDIGGAAGFYAIALCREHPELRATVLDIPSTEALAIEAIAAAGMSDRVSFRPHDYRGGEFPGPFDVALLSNVLRGESEAMIGDILQRLSTDIDRGGRVVITDLFVDRPARHSGLRAALFGLHCLDGANWSLDRTAAAVEHAGFELERVERLRELVVMNGLVIGRRP